MKSTAISNPYVSFYAIIQRLNGIIVVIRKENMRKNFINLNELIQFYSVMKSKKFNIYDIYYLQFLFNSI